MTKEFIVRTACFVVAALLSVILAPVAVAGDAEGERMDIEEAANTSLPAVCSFAAQKRDAGEPNCDDEFLQNVCALGAPTLDDAVTTLLDGEEVSALTQDAGDRRTLREEIKSDFVEKMDQCLNGEAQRFKERAEEIENDPAHQARVAEIRQDFWHSVYRTLGRVVARTGQAWRYGKTVATLRRMILAGTCSAGADLAKSFVSGSSSEGPTCSEPFRFDDERIDACFSTVSSACAAAGGFVNLSDWPGMGSEDEIVRTLQDIGSVGIEVACQSGGVTAPLCGIINASAIQIAKAIKTGNNDWAECTGMTQLGRCIGEWWGADGWTNDHGISRPRIVKSKTGRDRWVRNCCWCPFKRYYRDTAPGLWELFRDDEHVGTINHVSVIQAGDFESGNCGRLDDREVWPALTRGYEWDHYVYKGCRRVTVVGRRCTLQTPGGEPENLPIWDTESRKPLGKAILAPALDDRRPRRW